MYFLKAISVLEECQKVNPQFHINGEKNIWILKPARRIKFINVEEGGRREEEGGRREEGGGRREDGGGNIYNIFFARTFKRKRHKMFRFLRRNSE